MILSQNLPAVGPGLHADRGSCTSCYVLHSNFTHAPVKELAGERAWCCKVRPTDLSSAVELTKPKPKTATCDRYESSIATQDYIGGIYIYGLCIGGRLQSHGFMPL